MTRRYVPFGGLRDMRIDVPYSFLVRQGDLAWSCGQIALEENQAVVAPNDPAAQSERIARHVAAIVAQAGRRLDVEVDSRQAGHLTWTRAFVDAPHLSLREQTRRVMSALKHELHARHLDFYHVVKSTTHYVADASAEALHQNMAIRNNCWRRPGPASTGVPVEALSCVGARISVDLLLAA